MLATPGVGSAAKGFAMRRALLIFVLTCLVSGFGLSLHSTRVSADGIDLLPFQVCARDGKVNVLISWQGTDPGAREFWVDLTKVSASFDPDTYVSAGPIKAG